MDPLRQPNLADDLGDIERRLKVVEFGDPYDVNGRTSTEAIGALVDPTLHTLYVNDADMRSWILLHFNSLANWIVTYVQGYTRDAGQFYAHQHEEVFHSGAHYEPPVPPPSWMLSADRPQPPDLEEPTVDNPGGT